MRRPSTIVFAITALVLLLQLFPLTGVFLMIFGAIFWPIFLVNLGFSSLAMEVIFRVAPRWMLIFPIVWFGGYAASTILSHWHADQFHQSIAKANAGKIVAYDWKNQDLLIVEEKPDFSRKHFSHRFSYALEARKFISNYDTSRLYSLSGYFERGWMDPTKVVKFSIAEQACPKKISAQWSRLSSTLPRRPFSERATSPYVPRNQLAQTICLQTTNEHPTRPIIRVQVGEEQFVDGVFTPKHTQEMIITTPDGAEIKLIAGVAVPLALLPAPVFGCAIGGRGPSWKCGYDFLRVDFFRGALEISSETQPMAVLANALGLQQKPLHERYPDAGWK